MLYIVTQNAYFKSQREGRGSMEGEGIEGRGGNYINGESASWLQVDRLPSA